MGKHIKNAPLPEKEFDANEERWEYYRKTYPFEINTELLYLNTNKKRLVGRFTYSRNEKSLTITQIPKENDSDSSIVLSGDVFFNFNENKIQAFKNNVEDIDDETRRLLDDVSNRYHSDYHILSILLAQILDRYEQLLEDVDIECSTQAVVASVGHKCHTLHFARLD